MGLSAPRQFDYFDLSHCRQGEMYRVEPSNAMHVLLVDSAGFSAFEAGREHEFSGGLVTDGFRDFVIPRAGHWFLIYHDQGLGSGGSISIRPLLNGGAPPPASQSTTSLRSIAQAAAEYPGDEDAPAVVPAAKDYDVVIWHTREDEEAIVRHLAGALTDSGLRVRCEELEPSGEEGLRRRIDEGLADTRFGVVVLSNAFFARDWPRYELDGLVTREVASGREQLVLPIWFEVTRDEVIEHSPSLADKPALRTADTTASGIAAEIAAVIRDP